MLDVSIQILHDAFTLGKIRLTRIFIENEFARIYSHIGTDESSISPFENGITSHLNINKMRSLNKSQQLSMKHEKWKIKHFSFKRIMSNDYHILNQRLTNCLNKEININDNMRQESKYWTDECSKMHMLTRENISSGHGKTTCINRRTLATLSQQLTDDSCWLRLSWELDWQQEKRRLRQTCNQRSFELLESQSSPT